MPASRDPALPVSRRALLGGLAAGAAGATSGCLQRMQTLATREDPQQVRLEVKTVPADDDPAATRIGRALEDNLAAVGIDTDRVLLKEAELRRDVLVNRDFDIFVGRYPAYEGPDFLRTLLHSKFTNESGWQNPYGFTDLDVDELLEAQRSQTGLDRSATVSELQQEVAREQPFVTVAIPDDIHAIRADRFQGFEGFPVQSTLCLLALDYVGNDDRTLRLAATDGRVTRNLNPIAVEYRTRGTVTGLLYDPLARWYDGAVRPWLAAGWEESSDTDNRQITVELRDGLAWHDGTGLTADDVEFTYRFLQDTRLGEREPPVPAPRFRSQSSLVDDVERLDRQHVRLTFSNTGPQLALAALTVPILPVSEWKDTASDAEFGGVSASDHVTEALVWPNAEPVGSGPFQFDERTAGEELRLSRFDDHFLDGSGENQPHRFGGGIPFEQLRVDVVRSDEAAVLLVEEGSADATVSALRPGVIPTIGQRNDLQLQVDEPQSFYQVGFNTQRRPLGNPHIRRAVARLLDKEYIAREVFDGFAQPVASPLARTDWETPALQWNGSDPEVPFFGTGGDLDATAARAAFRDAGFEYDEDGTLLHR
ncbi:MAG: ABC transporter substrate-binding protein [Halovenus sp.]